MSSEPGLRSRILVTGGAGFIGSALVRRLVGEGREVVNLDNLTYSANRESLREVEGATNYRFEHADIGDGQRVRAILADFEPQAIMHLAAESHVDRSIDSPADFIETNIVGTSRLLDAALDHMRSLSPEEQRHFRFLHVSTDEVFGSLDGADDARFSESTAYDPSSPYSASKAASDHLARAWQRTYGLPVIVSNCSNNYGPYQFPEKLIPLTILNAIEGHSLPVYGKGENVRDWLHVDDHVDALLSIVARGNAGETYVVGGDSERSNIDVVGAICDLVDARRGGFARDLIQFVEDRPGHDRRYAIDAAKIRRELGWSPRHDFDRGLAETVDWYLANEWWWRPLRNERYAGERLGRAR